MLKDAFKAIFDWLKASREDVVIAQVAVRLEEELAQLPLVLVLPKRDQTRAVRGHTEGQRVLIRTPLYLRHRRRRVRRHARPSQRGAGSPQ